MPYGRSTHQNTEIAQQCISNFSTTATWSTLDSPAHTHTFTFRPINGPERISTSACARVCEQRGCYKARAQSADNRRAQRFFILKLNKITWKHQRGDVTTLTHWSGWFLSAGGDRTWPSIKHKGLLLRGNPLRTRPQRTGPSRLHPAHYALPPKQNPTISYSLASLQLPFLLYTHTKILYPYTQHAFGIKADVCLSVRAEKVVLRRRVS
jgi:hypothetical protein